MGFQVVPHTIVTADTIMDDIEKFQKEIPNNPFPTDGLVLSFGDQMYAEKLGSTGHHPRGSIAMKWTDETVSTTIRSIHWSVGKTGQITPVAVFDPVRLGAGSTVTRASLHNVSIMQSLPETGNLENHLPLKIRSKAEVYLANMIIPQVASISDGEQWIDIPAVCPVCGEPTALRVNNGISTLHCDNFRCPARTRGMLENAFCKDGLFVKGLGPSQIEDLQQTGMITVYPTEVFTLKKRYGEQLPKELKELEGWGDKSWKKLLDAIDAARKTNLKRFLYSLGVPMLGKDLSKKLDKFWNGDIEKFKEFKENPNLETLTDLEGVGDVKAGYLVDWCHSIAHDVTQNMMLNILIDELEFEAPVQAVGADANALQGLTFVITGSVNQYKNRDEFKASVEARGGKVAGSVSKNTNYLVNNDVTSTSGKNKKAKELNVPIISEDTFIEKFGK